LARIECPQCGSTQLEKITVIDRRQQYRCRTCGCAFMDVNDEITQKPVVITKAAPIVTPPAARFTETVRKTTKSETTDFISDHHPMIERPTPVKTIPATNGFLRDTTYSQMSYALSLLKDDAVNSFKKKFMTICHKYKDNPQVATDAFYETLVEFNDLPNIIKELDHWNLYISGLTESDIAEGVKLTLIMMRLLCDEIEKMRPVEKEIDQKEPTKK